LKAAIRAITPRATAAKTSRSAGSTETPIRAAAARSPFMK
jgi:hypothetical protein